MALNPWEPEEKRPMGERDGAYSVPSLSLRSRVCLVPHDSGLKKTWASDSKPFYLLRRLALSTLVSWSSEYHANNPTTVLERKQAAALGLYGAGNWPGWAQSSTVPTEGQECE